MNASEAKLTELEPERFEFTESFNAAVDVGLLSETVVSTLGAKLNRNPVVACVMRQLFIASNTYIFHIFLSSCRTNQRAGECLSRATKKEYGLIGEKRNAGLTLSLQTTQYSQSQLIIKDIDNGMKTSKKKQKDDFKLIISGFNITLSFY